MKLIITLSGKSKRFTESGYPEKPFIKVLGKYVIEHVRDMYHSVPNNDIFFIVRSDDWRAQEMLPELFPHSHVKWVHPNDDGPVFSILEASLPIDENEEVIVSYCDFMNRWDFNDFLRYCRFKFLDGCITTHRGFHPHRLYNKSFAFLRNDGNTVLEVREKESFTDNIFNEHASNGTYYFARFGDMKRYFGVLVDGDERTKGEFYVTMPYNLMLESGMKIHLYETEDFICFGTPEDIELVNAWEKIIKLSNPANDKEILELFHYWGRSI